MTDTSRRAEQERTSWLDRLTGAIHLPERMREELRVERVRRACENAAHLTVGFCIVAVTMAGMVAADPFSPRTLVWLAVALLMAVWLGLGARAVVRRRAGRLIMLKTFGFHALLHGTVWGLAPMTLVPGGGATVATAMIGAGGIVLTGSLLLVTVPRMSLLFILGGGASFLASTFLLLPLEQFVPQAIMVSVFGLSLPAFIFHQARLVARRHHDGFVTRERHATALLLLESYEAQGNDTLWECDAQGRLVHPSRKLMRLAGREGESGHGKPAEQFLEAAGAQPQAIERIRAALGAREAFEDVALEIRDQRDPTQSQWWSISGRPRTDSEGRHVGFVGIGRDHTGEHLARLQLARQGETDGATGLANRRFFTAFLLAAIERGRDRGHEGPNRFAVMVMDLERFRSINETFGHATGDALIVAAAQRIRATLRERLPGDHCLARFAGDEFALVLDGTGKAGAARIASAITQALGEPFAIEGRTVRTAGRVGIALAPSPEAERSKLSRADDADGALLQRAELALSVAKTAQGGAHRFFEAAMDVDQRARIELERDLAEHLAQPGAPNFELLYQPLVDPVEGRPEGMEALIRWHHPRLGTISPGLFIPMAERLDLIERIGRWSLMRACHDAAAWNGTEAPRVAVNISAPHFAGGHLIHHVREALESSGLAVSRLEIEVTESVLVDNVVEAERTLAELHGLGVHVALDDFGTGYSSLGYLERFAFDKLKIDRQFVVSGEQDARSKRILAMIVELGRALDMTVVAEGIETPAQARMATSLGCDLLQGFLFSRPISQADAAALIAAAAVARQERPATAAPLAIAAA